MLKGNSISSPFKAFSITHAHVYSSPVVGDSIASSQSDEFEWLDTITEARQQIGESSDQGLSGDGLSLGAHAQLASLVAVSSHPTDVVELTDQQATVSE